MKDYKRLTFKRLVDPYNDDCEENENASAASYEELLNRLAELEDKIENGTLVPRYSILKDWQYGWWCVCEVDEQSRIIAQCKTEEAAKRTLEELTNDQIYNTVIFN